MQPSFQDQEKMYQILRSKVSFKSNAVDAIRNLSQNKSILLHDLEMAQNTIFFLK